MNIHKHMEAIFVAALAVTGVGMFAFDSVPDAGAQSSSPVLREVAAPLATPVVMVRPPKAACRA